MRHIFLSPHMDDAVLSTGNLILSLIQRNQNVLVITVFSSFGTRPITWDSQKYIIKSGFLRLSTFAKNRKKEDILAMTTLGVSSVHLDFIDGGFRKNTHKKFLYPTHADLFSGNIAHEDKQLIPAIKHSITSSLHSRNWNFFNSGNVLPCIQPSDILYAPLGVGTHADHLIITRIARTFPNRTYYFLDQPYGENLDVRPDPKKYKMAFCVPYQKKKGEILSCYRSQIKLLYPHGLPRTDELYFIKA